MPLATVFIVAVGALIVGIVFLTIPKAVVSGAIPRNSTVGIRTQETQKSDEAWVTGHRKAEPVLRVTGVLTLAVTMLFVLSAILFKDLLILSVLSGALAYLIVLGGLLWGASVANKAAKETNEQKGI